jgi:hypothetical protein
MTRRISSASTRTSCRSAEDALPYRDSIINANFHADFATGCGMPAGTLSAITRSTLQSLHVTDQLLHVTRQHVATGKRVNSFIDGARRLVPSGGQGRSHKPRPRKRKSDAYSYIWIPCFYRHKIYLPKSGYNPIGLRKASTALAHFFPNHGERAPPWGCGANGFRSCLLRWLQTFVARGPMARTRSPPDELSLVTRSRRDRPPCRVVRGW